MVIGVEPADCLLETLKAFAEGFDVQSLGCIHGIPPTGDLLRKILAINLDSFTPFPRYNRRSHKLLFLP